MRRLSPNALREALLTLSLLAIEVVPVQAWLIVYAAAQVGDISLTAAPLWLIAAITAAYALARRGLARFGTGALLGAWALLFVASILLMARFSPLIYGVSTYPYDSISWLNALYAGQFDDSALFVLCVLIAYLSWRGTAIGKRVSGFLQVSRRFWIGLGALGLAIFGSLAVPLAFRDQIQAALLALFAVDAFAGLTALALSRPLGGASRTDALLPGAEHSFRWHALSLIMSFAVVMCVMLVSGAMNLGAAHELLAWLGPVGAVLNGATEWITVAIAYVLYVPVAFLAKLFSSSSNSSHVTAPKPPTSFQKHLPPSRVPAVYGEVAGVIVVVLAVVLVIVILFAIARAIASARDRGPAETLDEERENLETQGLLGQQARALLDRWRTRVRRRDVDPLRPNGMRWRFREVLRAGANVGLERAPTETASEYVTRLSSALNSSQGSHGSIEADLSALARAYEDARYGDRAEADPIAPSAVATQERAVTQRLSALAKGSGRRS